MKRIRFAPRADWQQRLKTIGFTYYDLPANDGSPYWQENAGYELSAKEVDTLEAATEDLHAMCMDFVKEVVESGSYPQGFALSDHAKQMVETSWRSEEPSLYGRFDLAFDGAAVKMLEYNADTPTSLLEAAVAQWEWKEDRNLPDQFNSLHEKLIERFRFIGAQIVGVPPLVHFAALAEAGREDWGTIEYLMDVAAQAGFKVSELSVQDLGWNEQESIFVDLENQAINGLFKLYAWEWMMSDEWASHCAISSTRFIEPPWKMLLSNKGLLPELWKRHQGHPLLLPAFYEADRREPRTGTWVRKPILSREGANVSVVENGTTALAAGSEFNPEYDSVGYVLQQLMSLPTYDGFHPIIGSWIVGDSSAGIGIREDTNLVTGNNSHFIPHFFR